LPHPFYEQIKPGGLLLAVIKNEGGSDNLFLLQKTDDHFESTYSTPCGFVQMTGKYEIDSLNPVAIESLPEWGELQHREIARRPFWWGGKGREFFRWLTSGIRSFLGITEPSFRVFKVPKGDLASTEYHYFGLWDSANMSLVLAKDDELISYGTLAATERLLDAVHRWVDLGMPTASSFNLRVYPIDRPLMAQEHEWIVSVRNRSSYGAYRRFAERLDDRDLPALWHVQRCSR
jgi:hypothetical protein